MHTPGKKWTQSTQLSFLHLRQIVAHFAHVSPSLKHPVRKLQTLVFTLRSSGKRGPAGATGDNPLHRLISLALETSDSQAGKFSLPRFLRLVQKHAAAIDLYSSLCFFQLAFWDLEEQ